MFDEFDLIEKIRRQAERINRHHPELLVPPGDDAALLSGLSRPVISTDCQRQDVHFRLDWQSLEDIGFKAVSVTLSDLAASFARPISVFVNLTLPSGMTEAMVLRLYEGLGEALGLYGCGLGGGNLSSGSALALDLFAVGEGDPSFFPRRSEARAGQGLYVTGPLGLARAGLHALEANRSAPQALIRAFKRPKARFDAARILCDHGIRCVTDISDGLAGDARHVAEASDLTVRFEIDETRLDPDLWAYCRDQGLSARDMMLAGGEDYELLFACEESHADVLYPALPGMMRVGTCLPFDGARILNPPHAARSFVHGGPAL
ncbi:thiamine-phosphate kinase [Desulfatiferula olefinivorans]